MTSFSHQCYILRKTVFKLFGGAFHIFTSNGALAFYLRQKAFKL